MQIVLLGVDGLEGVFSGPKKGCHGALWRCEIPLFLRGDLQTFETVVPIQKCNSPQSLYESNSQELISAFNSILDPSATLQAFTPSGHHPYWDYWRTVRHVLYKPRHPKVIAYHRLNVQNETKLTEILYHVSHRWDALVDANSHERILDDLAEFRRSTHLSPFTFAPRTGVVCCRLDS